MHRYGQHGNQGEQTSSSAGPSATPAPGLLAGELHQRQIRLIVAQRLSLGRSDGQRLRGRGKYQGGTPFTTACKAHARSWRPAHARPSSVLTTKTKNTAVQRRWRPWRAAISGQPLPGNQAARRLPKPTGAGFGPATLVGCDLQQCRPRTGLVAAAPRPFLP